MIYPIQAAAQHYAWGGYQFLRDYIPPEQDSEPSAPLAELWYGDHPKAPSLIQCGGEWQPLNSVIASDNGTLLTADSVMRYGKRLPFLLKLLDVRLPLSIQVHPNKAQAQEGFAKEEATGKAADAFDRLYNDDNHKPEMMVALSDFSLLHGFAPREVIRANLSSNAAFAPLLAMLNTHDLHTVYAQIMRADRNTIQQYLAPIYERSPKEDVRNPDYWVHYCTQAMEIDPQNPDPGLLSFYLLNIVQMKKGEGIMQGAQLPHAYLRGQNIELMAASDNVLRAGLTPKFVAIDELLRLVDCTSITPKIIAKPQESLSTSLSNYPATVDDFTLDILHLRTNDPYRYRNAEAAIVLAMEGEITLFADERSLSLKRGEAALITPATEVTLSAQMNAQAVIASSIS